jgi:orotate phosphoribosyltransferase
MRIEIRKRGDALAALDEKGNPLRVTTGEVKNYGRGNQVYLAKEWEGKKVIVVDVSESS